MTVTVPQEANKHKAESHGESPHPKRFSGGRHVRANIADAPKESDNGGASKFSRILLKCVPGAKSVRRLASSDRIKTTECPHLRTTFSYVHY